MSRMKTARTSEASTPRAGLPSALAAITALLVGCAPQTGMELSGTVDDTAFTADELEGQELTLGVWVGSEPKVGSRPDASASFDEIQVRRGDAVLNPFDWKTGLFLKPEARFWVAAYYEPEGAADTVPDPDGLLSSIGPFAATAETFEELDLRIHPPGRADVPTVAERLEDLAGVHESGDPQAFMDLIHPFYLDPWFRGFEEMKLWVRGAYAVGATAYADPVSAPLAGLYSTAVRDAYEMSGFAVETITSNENTDSGTVGIDYRMNGKLPKRQGILDVHERWVLSYRETPDDLLISRIRVQLQELRVQDVFEVQFVDPPHTIGAGTSQVQLTWADNAAGAVTWVVGVDRYDPETENWSILDEIAIVADEKEETVIIGPNSSSLKMTLSPSRFYRFRVHPVDDAGDRFFPSTVYATGVDYPY